MNLSKNLSLIKLSGITHFFFLDISNESTNLFFVKRNENFLSVRKSFNPSFKIIESSLFETKTDFENIKEYINKTLSNYHLKEAHLVIGINEFKFSAVSLPIDNEDSDLWFSENTAKFLPEGRSAEEFAFSYKEYKRDENSAYYYLVIARKNYIDSILNSFKNTNFRIIGVFPFHLSVLEYDFNYPDKDDITEKNVLFLDIKKDRISYCFKNNIGNLVYREIFVSGNNTEKNFESCLEDIKQTLIQMFGYQVIGKLVIYFDSYDTQIPYKEIIINTFQATELNPQLSIPVKLFFSFIKLTNDYGIGINLLNKDVLETVRELIEKKTVFRMILFSGIFLLFLLFIQQASEIYFANREKDNQKIELAASYEKGILDKLEKENTLIKSNISLIKNIQKNKISTSQLMEEIANTIPDKCCLHEIKYSEENDNAHVELNGYAYSQLNIVDILSRLEDSHNFINVRLIYSSSSAKKNSTISDNKSDMIKFSIGANYNDN